MITANEDIALKFNIDVAIFVSKLSYWISEHRKIGRHQIEGRTWNYCSAQDLVKIFPFWTERQLRRVIKQAIDGDIILSKNHNQQTYDRTKWYAFVDEVEILKIHGHSTQTVENTDVTKTSNGSDQKVKRKLPKGRTNTSVLQHKRLKEKDINKLISKKTQPPKKVDPPPETIEFTQRQHEIAETKNLNIHSVWQDFREFWIEQQELINEGKTTKYSKNYPQRWGSKFTDKLKFEREQPKLSASEERRQIYMQAQAELNKMQSDKLKTIKTIDDQTDLGDLLS